MAKVELNMQRFLLESILLNLICSGKLSTLIGLRTSPRLKMNPIQLLGPSKTVLNYCVTPSYNHIRITITTLQTNINISWARCTRGVFRIVNAASLFSKFISERSQVQQSTREMMQR